MRALVLGFMAAALLTAAAPVHAAQVPAHLAAIAVDLLIKLGPQISTYRGSAEEEQAVEEADSRLRQAGIYSWSADNVVWNEAATTLAESLGLNLKESGDWLALEHILAEPDSGRRRTLIEKLLEDRNQKPDEAAVNEAVSAYDAAAGTVTKDLARSFQMAIGDDDTLRILWKPQDNALQIVVSGTTEQSGIDYQTIFSGTVVPRPTEEGNNLRLDVQKNDPGVQVFAGDSLDKLRASIFGKWKSADGDIWTIEKASGPADTGAQEREDSRERIRRAQEQIKEIKGKKIYLWKHPSGKTVRQERFKRLDEPYVYEGEQLADPDAADKIAALEQQIAQAQSTAQTLPVDSYDPVEMGDIDLDQAQPVTITVTQTDGYSYTYRQAYFDGYRITADRTLSDVRDIRDLPDKVIAQLVQSWSPPEWIELAADYDPASSSLQLAGSWWRLHVTYSAGLFGMGEPEVERIHTPWSRPLVLTQANVHTAEGAAPAENF